MQTITEHVARNEVIYYMDGKLIGQVVRGDTSRCDVARGKLRYYGMAKLPNRVATSSGKKAEIVSLVKRQLKESYNAKVRKA